MLGQMSPKNKYHGSVDIAQLIAQVETAANSQPAQLKPSPLPVRLLSGDQKTRLHKHAEEILRLTEESISALTQDEQQKWLLRLAGEIAICDMSVRGCILGQVSETGHDARQERLTGTAKIRISSPPNTILRVTLPPLIGRKIKGSYNVYWKLKMALAQYEKDTGQLKTPTQKILILYKKYARCIDIGHTCDNDNWESRRTTNAISEALNYSDNPQHMSMLYTTVQCSGAHPDCVEITVMPEENLAMFLPYLQKTEPEQPLQ